MIIKKGFVCISMIFIDLGLLVMIGCQHLSEKNLHSAPSDGMNKPSERTEHCLVYVGNSTMMMFGGYNWKTTLNDTWELDIFTKTWKEIMIQGTNPPARSRFAMAYAGNSKVIVFGGDHDGKEDYLNDTWEYDTISHTWKEYNKKGMRPSPRKHCVMIRVSDEKLILFGGMESRGKQLDDTWEYNPTTHEWRIIPVFGPSARVSHSMAYIGNHKVFLFGGSVFLEKVEDELDDTWIYDVTASTWTEYVPYFNDIYFVKMTYMCNSLLYKYLKHSLFFHIAKTICFRFQVDNSHFSI